MYGPGKTVSSSDPAAIDYQATKKYAVTCQIPQFVINTTSPEKLD